MLRDSQTFSGFSVKDMVAARAFYEQKLGLEVSQDEMGLQLKLGGGQQVFVYQKDDHEPASFTVLNFVVSDINKTIDELVANGVVFEHYNNMPAEQDERGVLRGLAVGMGPDIAWFKDPSGNIMAVLQNS